MSAPVNIANTPEPPYYAVIFSSLRTEGDRGYSAMAKRMIEIAQTMPGFLGVESARDSSGLGITVSYWETEEDIKHWKQNGEHLDAQEAGKKTWYENFIVRISKVERAYGKQTAESGRQEVLTPAPHTTGRDNQ